jgi:hypothetical protein
MITTLFCLLAMYVLFLLYVEAMAFKRAWPNMSLFSKVLAAPVIAVAVLWDWFCNMVPATILFWDWPGSWKELVTARFHRYIDFRTDWRYRIARKCCDELNKFDPSGHHC